MTPVLELFALNESVTALEATLISFNGEARLDVLIALAWHLRQRDCQRALLLASEADLVLSHAVIEPLGRELRLARLSLVRAEVCWLFGELDTALAHADSAISVFERHGDTIGSGDARWLLVSVEVDRGNTAQRDLRLEQAIRDYRQGGDAVRLQISMARLLHHEVFRDAAGTSLRLDRPFDPACNCGAVVEAWLSNARATVASLTGDPGAAINFYIKAHRAAHESGQLRSAIVTATNCVASFSTLGDLDAALEWGERALALARRTAWPGMLGSALMQLGNVLILLGRYVEGKAALTEALAARVAQQGSSGYAINLIYLGELSLKMGELAAALDYFDKAEASATSLGMRNYVLSCWSGQATALCRLGRIGDAQAKVNAALKMTQQEGDKDTQIQVLRGYARLYLQYELPPPDGRTAGALALQHLEQALSLAQAIEGFILPGELLDELSQAQAACGHFELAFRTGQAANAARNTGRLEAARKRAIAMQIRQETERAHAEAAHQRQLAQTEASRAAALQEASMTLETLGLIGRELTGSLEMEAVFATLHRHVDLLLDATAFGVYLLDADGETLSSVFGVEAGPAIAPNRIAINAPDSLTARCARLRQEVVIDGVDDALSSPPLAGTLATLSLLFSPLMIGQRLLGVMTIQSIRACAYGERERSIFRTLCAYAAIALDNAAAYRQSESTLAQLRQTQAQLLESSLTDPLTGLRNRRYLLEHIENDVAMTLRRFEGQTGDESVPRNADLIFFMVDLDHFKSVNDQYGHAAGDRVLVQMRARMEQVFRESDYLIRWGGEEFLLVARAANRDQAAMVAQRICTAVSIRPFELDADVMLEKTCSVGFACFPFLQCKPRALTWSQVVALADQCLYRTKHSGRNGWSGVAALEEKHDEVILERVVADPVAAAAAGQVILLAGHG